MTTSIGLSLLVLTASLGRSQAAAWRITGTILDLAGHPIEGVEARPLPGGPSVMTDAQGRFRLMLPRHREAAVQFRRPGYRAQLIRFTADWTGDVVLLPGVYTLPEVRVTARFAKPSKYASTAKYDEYFVRLRRGLGQFVGREEIDRRGALHVAQLLEGRAGIRVSWEPSGIGTAVQFARCNERPPRINVYLDGRKLTPPLSDGLGSGNARSDPGSERPSAVGDMLDRIAINDVELVEIFRGPGELPPEFNDGNCAAISIWTRTGGGS